MIPSNTTKNIILAMGALYPTVTGIGFGIISGVLYDRGNYDGSRIAMLLQYSNWVLIFWSLAIMFFYYGLKYTFILRANIIIAEAELNAPRSTFGIGNLTSRSPARFLFVQLQITGFGGSAVTIVGGGGCLAWVIAQQKILSMDNIAIPLTGAFFWTTAMTAAFFVLLALVGAQTVRNRRRGLHQPSTGRSDGGHRSLPPHESTHKSSSGGPLGSTLSSMSRHTTSEIEHDGYPLQISRTTLGEDHSSLHAGISSEKYSMDQFRNHWEGTITEGDTEQGFHGEQETYRTPLSPPPRSMMASSSSSVGGPLSNGQPDANRSQIRESVFGGRTPREDGGGRPSISSPPQSPTSAGFNLPSRRAQGRNSGAVPRPSTSSANSQTSSTPRSVIMGTSPSPGVSASARLKAGSVPKNDVHSAMLISVTQPLPLAPVSPILVQGSVTASRIAAPPPLPPKQRSQPIPQTRGPGPTDRKHSLSNDVGLGGTTSISAPISVPLYLPPSRGPGGGYRTKSIDIDPSPL